MALSNTATPKYYGQFRDAVIRGEIPVCKEISMQMNRIDDLIANPGIWYDDQAVEGYIRYCESELTLTDGSDMVLLDSFKLWAEDALGWYFFEEKSVWVPNKDGGGGRYVNKLIKKRLIQNKKLTQCTAVLRDQSGNELGRTVKDYTKELTIITTVDHLGRKLVKTFDKKLRNLETILYDPDGGIIAQLHKTFSKDGKSSETTVIYNE